MVYAVTTPTIDYSSLIGKPHWRRTTEVYEALDSAPPGASYSQLIEYVYRKTGKRCSRKLIRKWKKETGQVHGRADGLTDISGQVRGRADGRVEKSPDMSGRGEKLVEERVDESVDGRGHPPYIPPEGGNEGGRERRGQVRGQADGRERTSANTVDGRERTSANTVDGRTPRRGQVRTNKADTPVQIPVQRTKSQTPNYLNRAAAVGIIAATILGLGWVVTSEEELPRQAIANPPSIQKTTTPPERKTESIEPKSLKITLTVSSPEDIKVKPGDEIVKGQVIADRPEEQAALLAKKTQLEIAIKQATLGLAAPPPPAPNFEGQEKALRQSKAMIETQTLDPGFQFKDRWLQEIFESEKIAQENQIKQRKLEKSADIETSLAKLQEAKAQYQQQLGQYQQQRERQRYELNSLQVQLAEVEGELQRVEAVRSPYSGKVKKVKVKGQTGNQLEVEVTVVPRGNSN